MRKTDKLTDNSMESSSTCYYSNGLITGWSLLALKISKCFKKENLFAGERGEFDSSVNQTLDVLRVNSLSHKIM